MGRSSIKSKEPIPLPHDGILQLYSSRKPPAAGGKNEEETDQDNSEIVRTALSCLSVAASTEIQQSPARSLITSLKDAAQITDQLQELQAYRSTLLQQKKQQQQQQSTSSPASPNSSVSSDLLYQKALYRILLEWFLSYQTPLPLRRAIQSNLDVLAETLCQNSDDVDNILLVEMQSDILESLWKKTLAWQRPLHSLHEALNYNATHDFILVRSSDNHESTSRVQEMLQFLLEYYTEHIQPVLDKVQTQSEAQETITDSVIFVEANVTSTIQLGIQWAGIVKTLLSDAPCMAISSSPDGGNMPTNQNNKHQLQSLESFIWALLICRMTPVDALSNLGIAYSRVLFLLHPPASEQVGISHQLDKIMTNKILPPLTAIAIVQGMAAVAPMDILLRRESGTLRNYFQTQSNQADPGVRLAALKGIHTLVSRCLTRVTSVNDCTLLEAYELDAIQDTTQGTLDIVLQAWENPPNRRLGNAIPSLFQKVVALMQEVGKHGDHAHSESFQDLVLRLLAQPSNRKGRYKALETLLPIVGSRQMIAMGGWKLMESLLEGVGDRNSHNAGPIAELWANILSDLLQERLKETCGEHYITAEESGFEKAKKKHKKRDFEPEEVQQVLPKWLETWVPSLASMLLSTTPTRRKQVAAFCLPRVMGMVGGRKHEAAAMSTYACILREIHECASDGTWNSDTTGSGFSPSGHRLGELSHHAIWATLEVARHAHLEKLVIPNSENSELTKSIAIYLPLEKLKSALTHFSATIRLVAFHSIQPVVMANFPPTLLSTPLGTTECEIGLWKEAFPYAIKTEGKEYKSSLLQCLTLFIDRVSSVESAVEEDASQNADNTRLPRLKSFVIDFLLHDVAVKQASYPASVAEKEAFSIELLDCILTFASRDVSGKSVVSKAGGVYDRRRRTSESIAAQEMIEALLGQEVIAALLSLLHSMWDGTRSSSFRLLSRLILIGEASNVEISPIYTSANHRLGMEARAVYLASSPRQREADTGARILAFLYFSLRRESDKNSYVERIADLLEKRLATMKRMLVGLLSGENDPQTGGGARLPLSHGLIHSLRLIVEHVGIASAYSERTVSEKLDEIYDRMTSVFCQAIQVSLTVVADVKEGSVIDGMDEDLAVNVDAKEGQTPLNVNTGAIGANGTFSSAKAADKDLHTQRLAIQRIVMGSWLLTRETCAALSAVLTSKHHFVSRDVLNRAGTLLISTLTSLKHAGAAFAAHRALQQISEHCFNSPEPLIVQLPSLWTQRLLDEISETEKVRDSTLRRSTGYALGFLAVMRSEMSSKADRRSVCPYILTQILSLSLPSKEELDMFLKKLGLSSKQLQSIFTFLSSERNVALFNQRKNYEMRSRVHALNVLRLIVLDAPLAKEVGPIIGDAIVSAIIGYNDDAWGVRNSSTMVFAATMLRKIDADKNASNTDVTSNNAITFGELFRSYPSLQPFLLSVLNAAAADELETHQGIPPIFPVLLLLSRAQPVANSGPESTEMIEPFIPSVFKSLTHKHHGIRRSASLALVNICSGNDKQSISSMDEMLKGCHALLVDATTLRDWNSAHGALLGLKELARSFPGCSDFLREFGLDRYFLRVAKWEDTVKIFPPNCISVILEVLTAQPGWESQVEEVCKHIVDLLENTGAGEIAGASELGTTVANILTNQVSEKVWDTLSESQDYRKHLSIVLNLLTCKVIDVRLQACKTIKKSIYSSVDRLLAADNVSRDSRATRLAALSGVFLNAIKIDLKRSEVEGAHPPTLRRLSRCLLECLGAYDRLSRDGQESGVPRMELIDEMKLVASELMAQDHSVDDYTPLTGNAAELLSFVTADHLSLPEKDITDDHLNSFGSFAALIHRLNDPCLSWRLRHSAAVSVENSQLLAWKSTVGLKEPASEQKRKVQHNLLEDVLLMLQDGDPDVRSAAGRAAHAIQDMKKEPKKRTFASVSQCVLEETYVYAYRWSSDSMTTDEVEQYASQLLRTIVQRCVGFEDKLSTLKEEFKHTECADTPLDDLLNTGTDRKIFEDEVANPYEEPILANQLAVRCLVGLHIASLANESCSASLTLTSQCEKALVAIKENHRQTSTDLLHDMTRANTIFAELYSLILASTAIIYLERGDCGTRTRLQAHATEILKSAPGHKLHPSIRTCLQCMATAHPGSPKTLHSIQDSLFLIPSST